MYKVNCTQKLTMKGGTQNANNRRTFKKSKLRKQNESCCFCNIR